MEKRQSVDDERELPEGVIHHVLSLISAKDAAQVSMLSKTWYSAWLRSPVLKLHHDDTYLCQLVHAQGHPRLVRHVRREFVDHTNKSLQRYRDSKTSILQLHLSMFCFPDLPNSSDYFFQRLIGIVNETPGLVKVLRVSYTQPAGFGRGYSKSFRIRDNPELFRILEAEALTEFSVKGGNLKEGKLASGDTIKCHRLRRLSLENVNTDEATFQSIISSCPLIEKINLVSCMGLEKIKVVDMQNSLKEFVVSKSIGTIAVKVEAPNLESFHYHCHYPVPSRLKLYRCQNLKKLSLEGLAIEDNFSQGFMSNNLARLEYLSATNCYGRFERLNISGNSLKSITLRLLPKEQLRQGPEVEINAPSMVSFEYASHIIPSLKSLATSSSTKCKCKIHIYKSSFESGTGARFIQLKEMLEKLLVIESIISLSIDFRSTVNIESLKDLPNDVKPGVEVEDLNLCISNSSLWSLSPSPSSSASALLDHLFWTCRPKSVGLYFDNLGDKEFIEFLCQRLTDRRNPDNGNSSRFWENALKDVEIERVNEAEKDGQLESVGRKKISFSLKWQAP